MTLPLFVCRGLIALIALIALGVLIAVGWRLASRRTALPCPAWLGGLVERDNPFTRTNRAAVIIGQLALEPGMHVLDVGCGPGRLTIPLAQAVGPQGEVTTMDIQPAMLRRAQEKARAAGLDNIRFLQAGADEGKLERNRFDRALLVTVLGEIPDREAARKRGVRGPQTGRHPVGDGSHFRSALPAPWRESRPQPGSVSEPALGTVWRSRSTWRNHRQSDGTRRGGM